MLQELYYIAGAAVAVCEVLLVQPLISVTAQKARCKEAPLPLEELLQGVQLCSEPEQAELPETELLLGFLHGDADALVTVIDLLFAVAIKRASKHAQWAAQYAHLCAQLRAAGQPTEWHTAIDDAVLGRATAEYCKVSARTVHLTAKGSVKTSHHVDSDVAVLQGSMRFLGGLFKEHLLPYALLRTLVGDLISHSEKGMDEVHAQPLVGLALVSLLHVCADAYVSAELPGHAQAAGQHARHLSNVLMRLRASVDSAPELSSDLQDLQFKLTAYASAVLPAHQHHTAARTSGDIPRAVRGPLGDPNHAMWPGLRQRSS